jgi:hypothetical protein
MTIRARARYAGHRFPAEIIGHAVWLYFRFPLGLRMVEELLAARGIIVSYETVRQWARKFGQQFANQIRRMAKPCGRETLVSITASWRTGSAGSPRSVGAPTRKGNCSASPGGMMLERIALAAALLHRDLRDARMDVAGAARIGDADNVAADA